jgi:hypothetical protein
MPNNEFAEKVLSFAGDAESFEPEVTYDPDGDCIEFITKPDPFYAERVDEAVTVYYSQESDELIGSLIKCVSKFQEQLLQQIPGFKISIEDGRIRLEHLFLAGLWAE